MTKCCDEDPQTVSAPGAIPKAVSRQAVRSTIEEAFRTARVIEERCPHGRDRDRVPATKPLEMVV